MTQLPKLTQSVIKRFYEKCSAATGGCIFWTGSIDSKGFGRFNIDKKNQLAHIISWYMKHQCPPVKYIKHTCGHNHCVNPDHLVEQDNEGAPIRISLVEIQAKKKGGLSTAQIAQELGCDPTTVRRRLKAGY